MISEAMATYGVGITVLQDRWRTLGNAQLGFITALNGDPVAGLAMCETARDLGRKNDSLLAIFASTVFLGVIKLMLGSVEEARELAQESVRMMWTTGDIGYNLFGALRSWALVESMNGNHANLVRLSGAIDAGMGDRAIVGNQHFDVLYHQANAAARLALGDLRADQEFARGLQMTLEETVAMVLAPPHAIDAAEDRLDGASAGAPETNLTKRERDVLRLLVKRFTDAEIADELFISKRTVGSHVRNICTKLGVKNRRAAAAIADRDLLV